ncbi:MAG: hypothetical protein EoVTN8_422 [Fluviibacter phosphoraccumulans EoVTN8]
MLIAGSLVNQTFPEHFIVLIHGIRTNGAWQSKLAAKLASHKNVRSISVGYGYFNLIRFLIPIWTRRKPVDKVLQQLRYLCAEHPTALISVVAHSFGSYIIAAILDYASDVRLNRLLLCGSVVRDSFRWDRAKPYVKGDIVNDVGTRDFYPIAAKSFSWGFGATGTLGFQTAAIHDRYFNCGHSDFFTDDHMESYWLPQLVDGKIVPSDWSSQRPPLSRSAVALMLIPFKWIFVALFVVTLYVLLTQFGILSSA